MRNYFKLRFSKAHWHTFCSCHLKNFCLAFIGFCLSSAIFFASFLSEKTFEDAVITQKYEDIISDGENNIVYHIVFVSKGEKYDATVNEDEYKVFQLGKQTLTLPRFTYNSIYALVGVCCFFSAFALILVSLIFLCRFIRQIVYYREYIWYSPSYDEF